MIAIGDRFELLRASRGFNTGERPAGWVFVVAKLYEYDASVSDPTGERVSWSALVSNPSWWRKLPPAPIVAVGDKFEVLHDEGRCRPGAVLTVVQTECTELEYECDTVVVESGGGEGALKASALLDPIRYRPLPRLDETFVVGDRFRLVSKGGRWKGASGEVTVRSVDGNGMYTLAGARGTEFQASHQALTTPTLFTRLTGQATGQATKPMARIMDGGSAGYMCTVSGKIFRSVLKVDEGCPEHDHYEGGPGGNVSDGRSVGLLDGGFRFPPSAPAAPKTACRPKCTRGAPCHEPGCRAAFWQETNEDQLNRFGTLEVPAIQALEAIAKHEAQQAAAALRARLPVIRPMAGLTDRPGWKLR